VIGESEPPTAQQGEEAEVPEAGGQVEGGPSGAQLGGEAGASEAGGQVEGGPSAAQLGGEADASEAGGQVEGGPSAAQLGGEAEPPGSGPQVVDRAEAERGAPVDGEAGAGEQAGAGAIAMGGGQAGGGGIAMGGTPAIELQLLLPAAALDWLADARRQPLAATFPAAARKVGHGRLSPAWTTDQAVRALLLVGAPADEVLAVYRHGDTAEKLAVLHALSVADVADALQDQAVPIIEDALRTNDQRLVAAALGPYATRHLSQHAFRHAVLKCVFANIPLAVVDGLPKRVDPELLRMMSDFATERSAAGRAIPADLEAYLNSPP
jgi:hypothetical protein